MLVAEDAEGRHGGPAGRGRPGHNKGRRGRPRLRPARCAGAGGRRRSWAEGARRVPSVVEETRVLPKNAGNRRRDPSTAVTGPRTNEEYRAQPERSESERREPSAPEAGTSEDKKPCAPQESPEQCRDISSPLRAKTESVEEGRGSPSGTRAPPGGGAAPVPCPEMIT